jgi:hypothetical protein
MTEPQELLQQPAVIKPIRRAVERPGLRETEPAAVTGTVFATVALAGFVGIVLAWGDQPAKALPLGVVGLVLLAFVQVVVLRRAIFQPSTVADIVRAFAGDKGLADVVAREARTPAGGRSNERPPSLSSA